MPVDPTTFVLGSGGANWGLPTTGWWNTPAMRSAGGTPVATRYAGGSTGGTGGFVSVRPPQYQAPGFNYAAGVAQPSQALTDLTTYINNLNRTAQSLANQARIPGAAGLETQSSQNIGAGLRGELGADVVRQLQRQAAERGINVGPESPNVDASYLQAIGLTSLERQRQAQQELSAAYARNPAAPLFDPTTQLLTPYQAAGLSTQQQEIQLRADIENAQLALEQERLRTAAAGGGGGGLRGVGATRAPTTQEPVYVDPRTRTYTGATGDLLAGSIAPDFSTQDWWASIGYGTPATSATGTTGAGGGGTFYAGPSYGGLTPQELYQTTGMTPEDWTGLGYSSLNELYGGG